MLVLIRHGESVANAQGLLIGRTDAELTQKGMAQASSVSLLLRDPILTLRSSPLSRARDTAALLAHGGPVEVDDRWVEVDYGEYDCQPLSDIPADIWREWQSDPSFRPAGGESLVEVDARVAAACDELFRTDGLGARATGGDVVVVSHVTPIKAAVAWALGMTAELSWRLHLQTASVTRIGWGNGHPVLHSFNEVVPNRDAPTHASPPAAGGPSRHA
jgi:broad specificity phosphatase PhoE